MTEEEIAVSHGVWRLTDEQKDGNVKDDRWFIL